MERLVIVGLIVAAALVVAEVLRRRRPDAPTQASWSVPAQLDRADFVRPDAPWLVALFSSDTCRSCADAWTKVQPLEADEVAITDVTVESHKDVHDRYGIDAVPTVVIADEAGVVRSSFLGPPSASELWNALAELRTD